LDDEEDPDPELTALLHAKVVNIKEEINWDKKEQQFLQVHFAPVNVMTFRVAMKVEMKNQQVHFAPVNVMTFRVAMKVKMNTQRRQQFLQVHITPENVMTQLPPICNLKHFQGTQRDP